MLWFWLFLASIMSLYDVIDIFQSYYYCIISPVISIVGEVCFAFLKATVIVYIYTLCRPKRWLHIIMILAIIVFSVFSITNFISYLICHRGITRAFFLILFETNSIEAAEFTKSFISNISSLFHGNLLIIALTLLLLTYIAFRFLPFVWLKRSCLTLSAVGIIYFMLVLFMSEKGKTLHFMIVRVPRYVVSGYIEHRSMVDQEKYRKPLPFPETVKSEYLAEDVIVVIGESSARMHNSLYGYNLPTNHYTEQIRDSLFILTDAIGSASYTLDNMPRILTFMPDSILGKWYDYPSVIDLFKTAGYRTYWLSNQERVGAFSNSSTCIAATADVVDYVGSIHSEDALELSYDSSLLTPLQNVLNDSASHRLCFLHLMGSHIIYDNRFPPQFAKFTAEDELKNSPGKWLDKEKAQLRADYDNSVLFTDSLLVEMIKMISSSPKPSFLIYFSDHGENIYDNDNQPRRSIATTTIPCWIYVNKAYRERNPEITARLKDIVNLRHTTANTSHLLLNMTGTTYKLYDPGLDILSDKYDAKRKRWVEEKRWPFDT